MKRMPFLPKREGLGTSDFRAYWAGAHVGEQGSADARQGVLRVWLSSHIVQTLSGARPQTVTVPLFV